MGGIVDTMEVVNGSCEQVMVERNDSQVAITSKNFLHTSLYIEQYVITHDCTQSDIKDLSDLPPIPQLENIANQLERLHQRHNREFAVVTNNKFLDLRSVKKMQSIHTMKDTQSEVRKHMMSTNCH